jgi:hypothetical protein
MDPTVIAYQPAAEFGRRQSSAVCIMKTVLSDRQPEMGASTISADHTGKSASKPDLEDPFCYGRTALVGTRWEE